MFPSMLVPQVLSMYRRVRSTLTLSATRWQLPFVEQVIKQLQAGETPEKEVYMEEHWYVNEDILSEITVDGEAQPLTVVTDDIIAAQY